jgi:hypothetical protein
MQDPKLRDQDENDLQMVDSDIIDGKSSLIVRDNFDFE